MRVSADRDRCEGHGLCEDHAPEVFELDDEGTVVNRYEDQDVPEGLQEKAAWGAAICPVAALRVLD